jgi:hypothetical protein
MPPTARSAGTTLTPSRPGNHPAGGWGPGAHALGLAPGQTVERQPYDAVYQQTDPRTGAKLGRPRGRYPTFADHLARLMAAEPHATAERLIELEREAAQATRQPAAAPQPGAPVCFVIMPFTERDDRHLTGFFEEVVVNLFTPAATAAGFEVQTAKRPGSDVIQATIVNDLLKADIVLADLTEHNPNVLFELGLRIMADKPIVLVRAKGTGPIFDIDNMLRVEEYDPSLWISTVEKDVPRLTAHILGTWENKDTMPTLMDILLRQG